MKNKYYWLEVSGGCLAIGGRPGMNLIELLKAENCSVIITLLKESERKIAEEIENKARHENICWV